MGDRLLNYGELFSRDIDGMYKIWDIRSEGKFELKGLYIIVETINENKEISITDNSNFVFKLVPHQAQEPLESLMRKIYWFVDMTNEQERSAHLGEIIGILQYCSFSKNTDTIPQKDSSFHAPPLLS